MDFLFNTVKIVHIICGFLAMAVFWIPIVTRKGGRIHNRIGWFYVYCMAGVSVTAWLMGLYRLTWNAGSDQDAVPFAWFLMFIAILSAATAWYGIKVLRNKRRTTAHKNMVDLLFPSLLLLSGVMVSIYGWSITFPLLQYFPIVGIFLGGTQMLYWLKVPKTKSHWIVEHIVGMLSCCISTVTAFTVFGAPRLLRIESVSVYLWFLPTIVIVPLIIVFSFKYKRKMDEPKRGVHI